VRQPWARQTRAGQTFAQIVADLPSTPVRPSPRRPGLYASELVGTDGRVYRQVEQEMTAERAMQIIHGGGRVVVDDCGCGGYCGLRWLSAEQVSELAAKGPPRPGRIKQRQRIGGSLHEFVDENGQQVLLLCGGIRWAR
jgi:hypothetical protein